jgi:serine/threonine protein kinase
VFNYLIFDFCFVFVIICVIDKVNGEHGVAESNVYVVSVENPESESESERNKKYLLKKIKLTPENETDIKDRIEQYKQYCESCVYFNQYKEHFYGNEKNKDKEYVYVVIEYYSGITLHDIIKIGNIDGLSQEV